MSEEKKINDAEEKVIDFDNSDEPIDSIEKTVENLKKKIQELNEKPAEAEETPAETEVNPEISQAVEEVMNKAFSLLPCYDCEHCSYLHDYCEDLEIAELNTKVIITMANSSVSQHLLLKKLKVQLPIDARALRQESLRLRSEVESLLPQLESLKAETDRLFRIRAHIRKVIPGALDARYADGRRTFEDAGEEQANRESLDKLLQQTADLAIANDPTGGEPDSQHEPARKPKKERESQSRDEAR